MSHQLSMRAIVVVMMGVAVAGCARQTAAPIDDRRPGVAMPPTPIAIKPAVPVPPPPPAEPEIQVQPIGAPPVIETRPLAAPGAAPPVAIPPAAAPQSSVPQPPTAVPGSKPSAAGAGARPEIKTEPRAFKAPYSEENLAMVLRGEDPRRVPAKPEVKPPVGEIKPPPVADIKPEAPVPPRSPAVEADRVDWMWPAPGRVIETFAGNTKGLAIGGRLGEPVVAAAGGRVVYSGSGLPGYGQLVIIKHNEMFLSAYAHNSRILVKEGEAVKKGQKVAELGSSDTDRPKLHFEIRRSGKPVDPIEHLPERR